uniref:CBM21 domain-containing protein n=1 Tax=Kryptolebias marmoratus TaxID=37003 RepID=A0A3Q3AD61_KRYMA
MELLWSRCGRLWRLIFCSSRWWSRALFFSRASSLICTCASRATDCLISGAILTDTIAHSPSSLSSLSDGNEELGVEDDPDPDSSPSSASGTAPAASLPALSAGKRVSFADTTGGDLVDVREFHAFDSDEEEGGSAKWEEEEAKYRRPEREPRYSVRPEFRAPGGGVLLQAVRAGKVEVEQICPVEDEPLAFSGLVRVLNVSFHKAVYIRSTLDSWATYFDHPAEYVQGSNDGETDQFSFKLSFAPPYTTHGSCIEFVVRYETSDGDYWANNSSLNYVVTLLLSYEEDPVQSNTDVQQKRSILKPPRVQRSDPWQSLGISSLDVQTSTD